MTTDNIIRSDAWTAIDAVPPLPLAPGWYRFSRETTVEVLGTDANDQVIVRRFGGRDPFRLPGSWARKALVRTWAPSVEAARQDSPEDHRGGMKLVVYGLGVFVALALWAIATRVEW